MCAAALIVAGPAAARAQNVSCRPGSLEVVELTFEGNSAFSDATLAGGVVTTPSSWTRRHLRFLGARHCIDRTQFPLDVLRLLIWYRNHGYASVAVDTVVMPVGKEQIAVRFSVREGAPTIVDSLAFDGLGREPDRASLLHGVPTTLGGNFDKYANEVTRDTLTQRLHNGGYPDAEVFVGYDTRTAPRRASVTFTVALGPRVRLGEIVVHANPQRPGATRLVSDAVVREVATVQTGDQYSEERLERAKRALYQTELFTHVSVVADSALVAGDSTVRVSLDVTEGLARSARLGGGYGTLDCFRTSGDLTQYNFLGGATRLDLHAKLSKIGVGRPLTGLEGLCPFVHDDPYSKDLNYYLGATISRPALFHAFVPSYSLYSERRSEYNAYLRTTPVGGSLALTRRLSHVTQQLSYSLEYGETQAQPALLCAVFNACVEADRESFSRLQRLGVVGLAVTRETSDNPVDPTTGSVLRFELRTAGNFTGSDPSLRFTKLTVGAAMYLSLTSDLVLAGRLQMGAVVGSTLQFSSAALYVPPQERLFAGGPTTVRGFAQNELGPALYIPAAYDTVRASGAVGGDPANPRDTVYFRARADSGNPRTVPTGGNALIVANVEVRWRSPFLPTVIQWTAFTDVGEVWNRGSAGSNVGFSSLRWTPGIGVRVRTIIGFLRLDVAYNPYQRSEGAAYFDAPTVAGGALLCVSPGNTLRVTSAGRVLTQESGSCASTYQPTRETSFFRRLTPSISIGQAF